MKKAKPMRRKLSLSQRKANKVEALKQQVIDALIGLKPLLEGMLRELQEKNDREKS